MPLSHPSRSHGDIAFGFYNIDTDGLLLNDHFFFCSDFCRAAIAMAKAKAKTAPGARARQSFPGFVFARAEDIGDLNGAIGGTRLSGFLGDIYRRWPFPPDPDGFRQKLRGADNREVVEAALETWAQAQEMSLARGSGGDFSIGPYEFSDGQFRGLLRYVRRGGYPTWEHFETGQCPAIVAEMAAAWSL